MIVQQLLGKFNYLSEKIANTTIWNPTLSELLSFLKDYEKVTFDVDENGSIVVKNNIKIPSRKVIQ